jgi:hypothetical protein
LRGHIVEEKQIFLRTYNLQRKKRTARHFIEHGKVYYLDENHSAGLCNFGIPFLNSLHTVAIEPLKEFYVTGESEK